MAPGILYAGNRFIELSSCKHGLSFKRTKRKNDSEDGTLGPESEATISIPESWSTMQG